MKVVAGLEIVGSLNNAWFKLNLCSTFGTKVNFEPLQVQTTLNQTGLHPHSGLTTSKLFAGPESGVHVFTPIASYYILASYPPRAWVQANYILAAS